MNKKTLNNMRFYAIYETYSEIDIEGEWKLTFEKYNCLDDAEIDIKKLRDNSVYRNVIGPLFLARCLEK